MGASTVTDATLDVGDTWLFGVYADADTASVVVTDPAGATTSPDPVEDGSTAEFRTDLDLPGRYLAVVTVVDGVDTDVTPFTAWAAIPADATDIPDLTAVRAYLDSNGETSATDAAITEALNAEAANQRTMCYVDEYGWDLGEALKRRVARNLAARAVPIASVTTFEGGTSQARVQRYDAEVTRFEGPYRRTEIG
jgi:hypothetical protein